jgi:phosphate transport system protein
MNLASPASAASASSLRSLDVDFAQMAALVETQLGEAILAFERRDVALAERVVRADLKVDGQNRKVDEQAVAILKTGALSDRQFRKVVTLMKLAGELERVGDLAKNVGKRAILVSRNSTAHPSAAGVARMGRASLRQLSDILNAYQANDVAAAEAVWAGDDSLDDLYNSLYQELTTSMSAERDRVESGVHLLFIVKNFERIGDHATNIAEAIHFVATGAHFAEARPKGEDPSGPDAPPALRV